MYFRIFAESVNDRIFNVVANECAIRGIILRSVDKLFDKRVMLCRCTCVEDLANIVSTLETDRDAFVVHIEDNLGESVAFRKLPIPVTPHYNRYTLRLCS